MPTSAFQTQISSSSSLSRLAANELVQRDASVFLSYCRFWEKHGFVQQSLARLLVREMPVIWLDGAGWRRYAPTFYWRSPKLSVFQMPELPARRLSWIRSCNRKFQGLWVKRLTERYQRPLIWVQAGLPNELESELTSVDVFSVFDDPYKHSPTGRLANMAKLIVCQNQFAYRIYAAHHPEKTIRLLPPVESPPTLDSEGEKVFTRLDRRRTMGYVGSFFSHDFDLDLFRNFVRSLPDRNFILVGRTDARGEEMVRELSHYPNFWYRPWVEPGEARAIWKSISVALLLYRNVREQHGAFPIKIKEAMEAGANCIATDVPKTRDLRPYFALSNHPNQLVDLAVESSNRSLCASTLAHFREEMRPAFHLQRVLEAVAMHSRLSR